MQHLEAHAQVAMKQKVLMDALWHIGRVRPEQVLAPIYGSAWRYRHRARLSVREVAKKEPCSWASMKSVPVLSQT